MTIFNSPSRRVTGIVLAMAIVILAGVNLFGQHTLPDDPVERIMRLQEAEMPARAEALFEQLLKDAPFDLDLHYAYINNHFEIPPDDESPRDDQAFQERYRRLAEWAESADVAHYGLGLIRVNQAQYEQALTFYRRVQNRDQKYLNNSLGYVYVARGENDLAEPYFQREIELGGNVPGAVSNLVPLYLERDDWDSIRALLEAEQTRPYVGLFAQRLLAFDSRSIGGYLQLAFLEPLQFIDLEALLGALCICATWFLYFWRIDIFEQEPLRFALGVLLLGALAAFFTSILSDVLYTLYPLSLGDGALNDLIYSLLYIGAVEETVKFVPVLLVVLFSRQVNEPIDLVIYGSLAALGFATLENSLYFSGYGLSIVFVRFLISTVLHMALTGYVCYTWAQARYIQPGNSLSAILRGLALAAVAHGLFDYFILGPLEALSIFSFLMPIFMAVAYGRMINNALNFSPYFDQDLIASKRLTNYALLLSTAVLLLLVTYLYNNFYYSTAIANQKLLGTGWSTLVSVAVIFGALGQFGLERDRRLDLWTREGKE